MWEESLRFTVEACLTHVSVYDLQVEQGTKFGLSLQPLEISSYCKSGYHCKHNPTYWKNKPFYAFGLGSAGYADGVRFSRPKKMKEYTGRGEKGHRCSSISEEQFHVPAASGGRVYLNTSIQVVSWHRPKLKASNFLYSIASEERFNPCAYRCHSHRENGAAENHGRDMRHSSDKRPAEHIKKLTGSSSRHWRGIAEKNMLRSIET
ncbi:hypothetical protein ACFX14_038730 [Malus domestica]